MTRKYQQKDLTKISMPNITQDQKTIKIVDITAFDKEFHWGKMLFTLNSANNHEKEVLKLIEYAKERKLPLFIASFIISYDIIVDHIIEASNVLKGRIFIITALNRNEVRKIVYDNKSEEEHFSCLERLSNAGVRIRNYTDGHWKIFLAGDESGIVTSANISKEAYCENPEIGMVIKSKYILQNLKNLFREIWLNYTTEELCKCEDIKREKTVNSQKSAKAFSQIGNKLKLYSTFNNQELRPYLLDFLRNATKSIDIMCYTINDKDIIEMINKKSKSVKIRIILPTIHSSVEKIKKHIALLDSSVETRYYRETHAKMIIIDKKRVFFSTGNLDTFLTKELSLDLAIFPKYPEFQQNLLEFFDYVFINSSKLDEITKQAIWKDSIELKILVDSPLRIAPYYYSSLDRYISLLEESNVLFYYINHLDNEYLVIEARKENKSRVLSFIEWDDGYRLENIPNLQQKLKMKEAIAYKMVTIKFYWLVYDIEEELLS